MIIRRGSSQVNHEKDLAFEKVSGEELDFEIGGMAAISDEDVGGDIPISSMNLKKLNVKSRPIDWL